LERLLHAEPVPATLTALTQHPLYVLESKIARHEGIYPKDATTLVGQVKGLPVYKRSAVQSLRSETGWLRENRQVCSGEEPHKVVAPPPSRPLASPSRFFGAWQTKPFQPAELSEGQPIPTIVNTNWYVLLRCPAPEGLRHIPSAGAARIARKMNVEFAQAVVGYVKKQVLRNRPGKWEAVLCGIVVRQADAEAVVRAHEEYVQLQREQEAARRKARAYRWWTVFTTRLLAMERLQNQFLQGLRQEQ
jgi:xeroderma pigmentosum group C-complementing protein